MTELIHGVARLDHLGVIRVEGADALSFLQGQLTQDFALLGPEQARLAAWCSAKGRMLASFTGFRYGEAGVLLVCERDLLAPTIKRLSMFVLRAKAKLSDASAEFAVCGLIGSPMEALAGAALPAWSLRRLEDAVLVALPSAGGQARGLWLAPGTQAIPAGPALSRALWQWSEVRSGVAPVSAATSEAFVPQMLNYESVGGVNFKKGCYPGQEIVARSQFRGTIKRRAYIVHGEAALAAGEAIFQESDPDQACGLTALAAAAPRGGHDAIISVQSAAAASGRLRAGSPDGPLLHLEPLPYALLEDI